MLKQNNPPFAAMIAADDLLGIQAALDDQAKRKQEMEMEKIRRAAALQANPFDVEAQRVSN
jgi:hypothetical protein